MLGLQLSGGYFLDLLPGTKLEMERLNPFLQFDNQLTGDYSMPLEVRLTPGNMKALQFAGLIQTKVNRNGIDCAAFDAGMQYSVGKLKVEKPSHNLINANRARISLYYLTGAAGFFQDIRAVTLRSINLGGTRSFPWDDFNIGGTGFWGHIHQVLNGPVNAFDYAFYPVINKQWSGQDGTATLYTEVINWIKPSGSQARFHYVTTGNNELNVIIPFPYLHKVLAAAVAKVGWKIDGAILQDPDFLKITMVNLQAIDWGHMNKIDRAKWAVLGESYHPGQRPATIQFNLVDHLPDITISDFLLALKNRMGWWYDFDNRNKTIRINDLQSVITTANKDYTAQASSMIEKTVAQTPKIYALRNEFLGEYAGGYPALENVYYQGALNTLSQLPAASAALYAHVYKIREQNNFFICRPVPGASDDAHSWQFYAYNVYDVVPVGATEEVRTKATTLGVEKYNDYLDLVPRLDMAGNWNAYTYSESTWSIHLVMYHGIRNNKQNQPLPTAGSGIYDSRGLPVSAWALAFECEAFDGSQLGLYHRKWKAVLERIQEPETLEGTLYLDRADYYQLKFSDVIIIAGVKMILTKINDTIPYSGELKVEALRI